MTCGAAPPTLAASPVRRGPLWSRLCVTGDCHAKPADGQTCIDGMRPCTGRDLRRGQPASAAPA